MPGCLAWAWPCECFSGFCRRGISSVQPIVVSSTVARPQRARIQGLSPLARASKKSTEKEIHAIFQQINGDSIKISEEDLNIYLCTHLGYGQSEAERFFNVYGTLDQGMSFPNFKRGYPDLNPFFLSKRTSEIIVRKQGSLSQQQVNLEELCNCEVYICDPPGQVFVDACKNCLVVLTAFDGPACFRDCENCTFWVAAQQVRVKDCKSCVFYIYAKTPPTMVNSMEISVAPWCASFLNCRQHFESAGFDVQRNFWKSFFDFSGKSDRCNLRICALHEVVHLRLHLQEGEHTLPDNPCPIPTHDLLCQQPLVPDDSEGQPVSSIPQPLPRVPDPPLDDSLLELEFKDSKRDPERLIGASFLNHARSLREQKIVLNLISQSVG